MRTFAALVLLSALVACDDVVEEVVLLDAGSDATAPADAPPPPDAALDAPPDASPCRQPGKGVILGDSIAYSAFVNSPEVFAAAPDAVSNLAYPGHTTEQQRQAWLASPLAGDPDVRWVVVQVGVNDLRRGRTDAQLVADYRALRDTLAESNPGAEVIWALMLPCHANQDFQGLAYPRWQAANAVLASEFGARTEASLAMNDGADNLRPEYSGTDGLHPNLVGNRFNASWMVAWAPPLCR